MNGLRGCACLGLALLVAGCRTVGAAATPQVSVQTLEVSFETDLRAQLHVELQVSGGGGVATQAQWQLRLDGRPLGSGVQLVSQRLAQGRSTVSLNAPLPLPHTARDEGWRAVTLELSGELTVKDTLEQRWPFSFRRQLLARGAPLP